MFGNFIIMLFLIGQETGGISPPKEFGEKIIVRPAAGIKAFDTPNDAGKSITIQWNLSPDDKNVEKYEIWRLEEGKEKPVKVGEVLRGYNSFIDNKVENGKKYRYFIRTVSKNYYVDSDWSQWAIPKAQWFHTGRTTVLIIVILLSFIFLYYIQIAKRGKKLYIREIAGLQAIDDAVGRATEMGRPVFFVFGLADITYLATLAALAILKRVAMKAAEYAVELFVPNCDPVVMATAQEVVKEGYLEAGRPDLYKERNVFFLTRDQFGYAAGVDGLMMRYKPGAVFLQGYFYAESLILAETGNAAGAIQIAGTTAVTQLPYLVAACDYVLIGEEMLAASAILSKDPTQLGTLKAEDIGKLAFMIYVIIGVILSTIYAIIGKNPSATFLHKILEVGK